MAQIRTMNPPELGPPFAPYSQIARVKAAEFIYIAGQVGTDEKGAVARGFEAQCARAYDNIAIALRTCDADWSNVVQFTTYLVNPADIPRLREFRMRHFPVFFPNGAYPTNTLLIVKRLLQEEMLLEVQTVAAL